jgi:hypothetical protein
MGFTGLFLTVSQPPDPDRRGEAAFLADSGAVSSLAPHAIPFELSIATDSAERFSLTKRELRPMAMRL